MLSRDSTTIENSGAEGGNRTAVRQKKAQHSSSIRSPNSDNVISLCVSQNVAIFLSALAWNFPSERSDRMNIFFHLSENSKATLGHSRHAANGGCRFRPPAGQCRSHLLPLPRPLHGASGGRSEHHVPRDTQLQCRQMISPE